MAEGFRSPLPQERRELHSFTVHDESATPKWRVWDDVASVAVGRAHRSDGRLVFSISPGEWIIVGEPLAGVTAVDLTHVRAMLRLSGPEARRALQHLCALDLSDDMTPDGAAARTLVAGVATELVRDDVDGVASYLLMMSRSFARHTWDRLVDVGTLFRELGAR